ncbi:MAG: 3,4-dehydroadipyl-CoA semialdehyde dehydrogenase [Planctomycetota bacterium]|jgi:3,4-dehydroadipyl-CoA semialdehyde dehydrogenase
MITCKSYVQGQWHTGTGKPVQLLNATTEEPVAEVNATGIDMAATLAYGRDVGGPALRALSFVERAAMLKALSGAIYEHREELIELSTLNAGNTRGDAKFDIDGATGTLAAYASFGRKLGDRGFLSDGEGLQLGRTARFWGQHISVPRQGVGVHINAFNFPAWGQMEKVACALLAGVPVIEKPGTSTALVAWRVAEITIESGILPEGAFQFICGSTGDLLDHMGPQDTLAFTGSSGTGAMLRGNANLITNNVPVNLECDSLNSAVLAPDVDSSCETYDSFLQNVVQDMTQKTGQKCTAVRRIFVPADRVEEVGAELVAALGRIKIGDPSDRESRMGPLASAAQFKDVRAGIDKLLESSSALTGGSDPIRDKGYFLAPTLLVAKDADTDVFHSDEVFGPVATILPYNGEAAEAIRLVNRGGGGLVSSLYSNDSDWAEQVVLGIAPWHGRVWVANDRSASQALPPGMVLPAMIHGGPGRAGGGEELGGIRGLAFYQQRVAVQGFKGTVHASFGEVPAAK